ncbi:N-terminal asparagine [Seminavis robusta]|uniref:N-terminal asparagine n=1 Tax=Seminavis robusta TaxID=568900 RepID=A0A9N8EVK3_9STRA|nr:N-terminal asparagine [Seminavis robusta]|eukprot:Sro2368_g325140.1 N-terminal asparagine (574) ;mRNA; r:12279-14000
MQSPIIQAPHQVLSILHSRTHNSNSLDACLEGLIKVELIHHNNSHLRTRIYFSNLLEYSQYFWAIGYNITALLTATTTTIYLPLLVLLLLLEEEEEDSMGGGGNTGMKKQQRCSSCHSLTSLCNENKMKHCQTQTKPELEPTALFLSSSPTSVSALGASTQVPQERLYLPRVGTAPCSLDVYLQSIPSVASRSQQLSCLSSKDNNQNNNMSTQRCLNVLQGEVAHATPAQTDVLVSAEATTCHIVALRSTQGPDSVPLGSIAHVDQAQVYNDCLEKMVQEHIQHHIKQHQQQHDDDFGFFMEDDDDDSDCDDDSYCDNHHNHHHNHQSTSSFLPPQVAPPPKRRHSSPNDTIKMELHIAGGYLDDEGTSQSISDNLVRTFSDLALKYEDQIQMSLSTAMISSMNTTTLTTDNQKKAPCSRGLALNTHTGLVTPIATSLPHELEGPAVEVRSARLWSQQRTPSLAVIHTADSVDGNITIDPFPYQPQPQLNALLRVDDTTLLQVASTSPQCESERFCSDLRRTLSFVNTVPASRVFGGKEQEPPRPLVYSRSANTLNQWEPTTRRPRSATVTAP